MTDEIARVLALLEADVGATAGEGIGENPTCSGIDVALASRPAP